MEDARNMEVMVVEEEVNLKKEIACHPLFGILKESHLKLQKVCLGDDEEEEEDSFEPGDHHNELLYCVSGKNHSGIENGRVSLSELDLFMEAYCMTLMELKKSIQEPIHEAASFVEFMHYLLLHDDPPTVPFFPSPPSPGEEEEEEEEVPEVEVEVEEALGEEMEKLVRIN